MLEIAAATQVVAHLRPVGSAVVKGLALIPLTLAVVLLAAALIVLPFTRRQNLVVDLLKQLDRWTSTILSGGTRPPRT